VHVSCHQLWHTMATQLLNADADLSTIQDLLGHTHITTTQRYCKVSNLKVQRDYYSAIELVMQRTQRGKDVQSPDTPVKTCTPSRSHIRPAEGTEEERENDTQPAHHLREEKGVRVRVRNKGAENTRLTPEEKKGSAAVPLQVVSGSIDGPDGVPEEGAHRVGERKSPGVLLPWTNSVHPLDRPPRGECIVRLFSKDDRRGNKAAGKRVLVQADDEEIRRRGG
jgi:hypothetical protein